MSEGKAEIRTEGARKEEKNWSHHFFDNDKKSKMYNNIIDKRGRVM